MFYKNVMLHTINMKEKKLENHVKVKHHFPNDGDFLIMYKPHII